MKCWTLLAILCAMPSPAKSQKNQDETEKIKQVLITYFEGIGTRNTNKMKEVVTKDFFLYEEGKVWTNDSVFNEMKRFPYVIARFRFDNFRVNMDVNSAYLAYYEEANFFMKDSTKHTLKFLGSAAFRKANGGWKMSFLHSGERYVRRK